MFFKSHPQSHPWFYEHPTGRACPPPKKEKHRKQEYTFWLKTNWKGRPPFHRKGQSPLVHGSPFHPLGSRYRSSGCMVHRTSCMISTGHLLNIHQICRISFCLWVICRSSRFHRVVLRQFAPLSTLTAVMASGKRPANNANKVP